MDHDDVLPEVLTSLDVISDSTELMRRPVTHSHVHVCSPTGVTDADTDTP